MTVRLTLVTAIIGCFAVSGATAASQYGAPAPSKPTVAAPAKPAASKSTTATVAAAPKPVATSQRADLRVAMRKLWEDHITYTRNYIISAVAKLPDTDAVAARLMKNQEDIGNAIKPYFGDAAGTKLTGLLKDHISIATEVVKAAMANDNAALDAAQKKWSQNGKDIADFLAGANPNWDKATMEMMLQKHLDLTTGEVVGRLKQDWNADISSYDQGHDHMLMFADMLTDGIVKQFPKKFTA